LQYILICTLHVLFLFRRVNALSEDLDNVKAGCGGSTSIAVRPETRHGRSNTLGGVETRLANLETNVDHILEILTQMNQRQGTVVTLFQEFNICLSMRFYHNQCTFK